MGLFGKFKAIGRADSPTLNAREAVLALIFLVSEADDEIDEEEIFVIIGAFERMELFAGYDIDLDIRRVFKLMRPYGVEAIIKSAKNVLNLSLRETAFAIAVDIALSDGFLDEDEEVCLNKLYEGLGIQEDLASKIIEVMLIKNRG